MRFLKYLPLLSAALLLALGLAACDSAGPDDDEVDPPLETIRVEDLVAGPTVSTGGGRPQGTGEYTFYDLDAGRIVEDSASTAWDVAFQATNILVNGGASGPGQGAGYIAEEAFREVGEVATSRLQADTESSLVLGKWYSYDANGQHYVRPTPGRTLVVRTGEGEGYAKIKILSYYKGAPELPIEGERNGRHYTFEYVLQMDGSTSFQ